MPGGAERFFFWEDLLNYRPNDPMVKSLLPQAYYIMAVEFNRVGNPSMGRQAFKNALSVNNNHSSWLQERWLFLKILSLKICTTNLL